MESPGFTSTSMTATSLKLPMSGTRTSRTRVTAWSPSDRLSGGNGVGFGGINPERTQGLRDCRSVELALIAQRLEHGERDEIAVHLEVLAQRRARVRAAVAVGAERHVAPRHPLPNLIGHRAHVVGRRDDDPAAILQTFLHVRDPRRLARMKRVPTLALQGFAPQLTEARDGEHIDR